MKVNKKINSKIYDIINTLEKKYSNFKNKLAWVVYGSYATNTETLKSDMDLLCIVEKCETPYRIGKIIKGINITIYVVSLSILESDVIGKYGGYFCGKLMNVNYILSDNIKITNDVKKISGNFIFELINCSIYQNRIYSSEEILKIMIKTYILFYPEYIAYVIRLTKSSNFDYIVKNWEKSVISFLSASNKINKIGTKYMFSNNIINNYELGYKIKKYTKNFYNFGNLCHNNNFEKNYKEKNRKFINQNKLHYQFTKTFLSMKGDNKYELHGMEAKYFENLFRT